MHEYPDLYKNLDLEELLEMAKAAGLVEDYRQSGETVGIRVEGKTEAMDYDYARAFVIGLLYGSDRGSHALPEQEED